VAHSYIEDIIGSIPEGAKSVICGDWNARIGEMSPTIGDVTIPRKSLDTKINARALWLIELCEQQSWYILNGLQPGPPASYTFARGTDNSCIDLILAKDCKQKITCDPDTLKGLSDHVLITTQICLMHT
jgi:Endonuclease-reverse transcriptase